ncbi:hypothetical protein [Acidovorax sp. NCPPB 4044]|uniref:hypothetical protein n=1 Tax=Acidovorax sp. NCPPB 4044 TaxID=2940490 RepID=UPI0023048283|nr:hypothetical protein [Acidovorax sp. NCPPB 4044]MDA8522303.1 hypothetical protein [Acidovorax sp. NCPPB 4044]
MAQQSYTALRGSGVKVVQRGTNSSGANSTRVWSITISSVDISKCRLVLLGIRDTNAYTGEYVGAGRIRFLNATTLEVTRTAVPGANPGCTVSWQIEEVY